MAAARPAARRSRSAWSTPSPAPLASYGKQYIEGFKAGLAYATNGTNKVGDRPIEVTEVDDAGDPAKAVSAAKDLIGKGVKIIAGSTASGVALQVAPIAAQNKVLFISGPAATDGITGVNRTRSAPAGSRTRTCSTAKSFIGDAGRQEGPRLRPGQRVRQGQRGGGQGGHRRRRRDGDQHRWCRPAPPTSPRSPARSRPPSRTCSSWPGPAPPPPAMWQALDQQGVLALDHGRHRPGHPGLVADLRRGRRRRSRSCRTTSTARPTTTAAKALQPAIRGGTLDLFHPDGFTAAQMVVRAIERGRRRRREDDHRAGGLELRRGQGQD